MADEFQLKMIVSAVDKASGVLKDVSKNSNDFKSKLAGVTDGLKNVATVGVKTMGIIGGVGMIFKKAMDLGKEGAMLDFTADKFDKLSVSIKTTSDALLTELRIATRGMYDDAELMASATNFMTLGLANTQEEVVRLANVSAGLNMNMNQLVLTLTNMTTMRFDALGVKVDGFKEKVKALEDTGLSADAAFKEAFLQQAEAQLNLVGYAADSAASAFAKFDVNIKTISDSVKMYLSRKWLEPAAEGFNAIVDGVRAVDDATKDYNVRLARQSDNHLEYLHRLYDVNSAEYNRWGTLGKLSQAESEAARQISNYTGYIVPATVATKDLTEAQGLNLLESRKLGEYLRDQFVPGLDDVTKVTEEAAEAISEQLLQSMSDLKSFVGGQIGPSLDDFNDKQKDVQSEIVNIQGKIDELNAKKWLTNAQKEELAENVTKLGELKTQYSDNADAHEEATKRILYDILLQRGALVEMTTDQKTQWNKMMTDLAKDWGIFDTATALAYQAADGYALNFANGAGMAASKDSILGMIALLERIKNTDWNVNATVTYQAFNLPSQAYDKPTPVPSPNYVPPKVKPIEKARGMDAYIPSGYPNDSYYLPLAVTSGERVQVTPAGKNGNNGGGDIFNFNIYGDDPVVIYRQVRQLLDADLRARRNAGIQYAGL